MFINQHVYLTLLGVLLTDEALLGEALLYRNIGSVTDW